MLKLLSQTEGNILISSSNPVLFLQKKGSSGQSTKLIISYLKILLLIVFNKFFLQNYVG